MTIMTAVAGRLPCGCRRGAEVDWLVGQSTGTFPCHGTCCGTSVAREHESVEADRDGYAARAADAGSVPGG
jgi:hypothetical protein